MYTFDEHPRVKARYVKVVVYLGTHSYIRSRRTGTSKVGGMERGGQAVRQPPPTPHPPKKNSLRANDRLLPDFCYEHTSDVCMYEVPKKLGSILLHTLISAMMKYCGDFDIRLERRLNASSNTTDKKQYVYGTNGRQDNI